MCDCGKEIVIRAYSIKSGNTKSCGCLRTEINSELNSTHRESSCTGNTKEWRAWYSMKERCCTPGQDSYKHYGGRGIAVCDRWVNSFENFLEDMGRAPTPDHTLDRFPDVNGNYGPGNVRWATPSEQARNKTTTIYADFNGEIKCVADWSEQYGIHIRTLRNRLMRGWSIEKALLTTPIARYDQKKSLISI